MFGFCENKIVAVVVGAGGGIGDAFVQKISIGEEYVSLNKSATGLYVNIPL